MKISVLIPSFNSARTIEASLESVFAQSVTPDEVVVLLDGGTDDTEARLARFGGRIRLLKQTNQGVACARNRLVNEARGDIVAFLDADDLWHPKYLEIQLNALCKHTEAVASFTRHVRFQTAEYKWNSVSEIADGPVELLDPLSFFSRYNITTAVFGSMSYCCVKREAFDRIGPDPFSTDLHAVEDSYLCYQLALLGSVILSPAILVAYRLTEGSLSVNRVRNLGRWACAFERLASKYRASEVPGLFRAFEFFHASKRREYAKVLLGVGDIKTARLQLRSSLRCCSSPRSRLKSFGLLWLSYLPKYLQPTWPSSTRQT